MQISVPDKSMTEAVVKRAFYLAWKACGGPTGMGFMQNRPEADEDAVWKNVSERGDYAFTQRAVDDAKRQIEQGTAYGDYVFGRMMKLRIKWNSATGVIDVSDSTPTLDYEAWCGKYRTHSALIEAAIKSLPAHVTQ